MFLLNTRIDKCTVVCSFGGLVYMHETVRVSELHAPEWMNPVDVS